jgi:hypothetical protein
MRTPYDRKVQQYFESIGPNCRVFHIGEEQFKELRHLRQLSHGYDETSKTAVGRIALPDAPPWDPRFCVEPYPYFAIRSPIMFQPIPNGPPTIEGAWGETRVDSSDNSKWRVFLTTILRDNNLRQTRTAFFEVLIRPEDGTFEVVLQTDKTDLALKNFVEHGEDFVRARRRLVRENYRDGAVAASFVASFCLMLNHRDVSTIRIEDPFRPPTRQQRRAEAYVEREHYLVELHKPLSRIIHDATRGKHLRQRRPHEVRKHLRHLRDGKLTTVKAHTRCGVPSRKSEYDATRLHLTK